MSNTGAKSKQVKCDERSQEESQRGVRIGSFRCFGCYQKEAALFQM